jgi:uncharacterized protein
MAMILMPKATAVWLIDNTTLTFEQIAAFCGLHPLEVKGIADGDVAQNMRGSDPVAAGDLSRDEIEKAEKNADYRLKPLIATKVELPPVKKKGARYTPISRRQDRPNAIAWFLRYHPEITDAQISKMIGTTKSTIDSVRSRGHWNSANIKPQDPVTLGLCTQIELDDLVMKASKKRAAIEEKMREAGELPADLTPGPIGGQDVGEDTPKTRPITTLDELFKR